MTPSGQGNSEYFLSHRIFARPSSRTSAKTLGRRLFGYRDPILIPHPEALGAISAFTRIFDALWRRASQDEVTRSRGAFSFFLILRCERQRASKDEGPAPELASFEARRKSAEHLRMRLSILAARFAPRHSGRASARAGIHNHETSSNISELRCSHCDYGFRARAVARPGMTEAFSRRVFRARVFSFRSPDE